MRIDINPRLPDNPEPTVNWLNRFVLAVTTILRDIAQQLNNTAEGYMTAATNAYTAAPTTGSYAVGDFIRNSTPAETGTAGSKYVIMGWVCTTAGSPGTWKECRVLTGG